MSLISGCEDVASEEEFYKNAEIYWKSIPANLNGMLGGYERISAIDVRSSQLFLKQFTQACLRQYYNSSSYGVISSQTELDGFMNFN